MQPSAPPHRQAAPSRSARNLQNWSAAEDALIRSGVESFGRKWGQIAAQLPGRHLNAVKLRANRLQGATAAAEMKHWSAAEDALIRSGIESFGRKWGQIAAQLPGRSDENCRSRWSRLPPATGATAAAAPHGL